VVYAYRSALVSNAVQTVVEGSAEFALLVSCVLLKVYASLPTRRHAVMRFNAYSRVVMTLDAFRAV
jgi:hypothetical protein